VIIGFAHVGGVPVEEALPAVPAVLSGLALVLAVVRVRVAGVLRRRSAEAGASGGGSELRR
jgi:hypothetical protein